MADFQEAKERKSLVLEALFEVLFRVLKHAANGPARRAPQQNGSPAAAADAGAHTWLSALGMCMLKRLAVAASLIALPFSHCCCSTYFTGLPFFTCHNDV